MLTVYSTLLTDFPSGGSLHDAVITNNRQFYQLVVRLVMEKCEQYRLFKEKHGAIVAGELLSRLLIVFYRQVKAGKAELSVAKQAIHIQNGKTELLEYIDNLLRLCIESGEYGPFYSQSCQLESQLKDGRSFEKLKPLNNLITGSLKSFGCMQKEEADEIINESLITFWHKLKNQEIGLFFTKNPYRVEECLVFNRTFYQTSKLSTYLTGIARNIFLNRLKTFRPGIVNFEDYYNGNLDIAENEQPDNQIVFMYQYYRIFIENRKLRAIISLLQYDCNLEDREVRLLLGINNARIHSCRLRANFHDWYKMNLMALPMLYDKAAEYLAQRNAKNQRINKKLRFIDRYKHTGEVQAVDIGLFVEEFRTENEFTQFCLTFSTMYYLATVGKPSQVSGLTDEGTLREQLAKFKEMLFGLPNSASIAYLIYYATGEPAEVMLKVFAELYVEYHDIEKEQQGVSALKNQLSELLAWKDEDLKNQLYKTNQHLFRHFTGSSTMHI